MLSDQQTSGSLSCLPTPQTADSVSDRSAPPLKGSFSHAGNCERSSVHFMSSSVVATPLSLHSRLQWQNTSVPAAVSRTCVAASLPVQRSGSTTTFALSSPLQPTPLAAAAVASVPKASLFTASDSNRSGVVRTWNCSQNPSPTTCPSARAAIFASEASFWTSRYSPGNQPKHEATKPGIAAVHVPAGAVEAYHAEHSAVPPSEYSTVPGYRATPASEEDAPHTAADYTRVSATAFPGTAVTYAPGAAGTPMPSTPITPSAGDLLQTPQPPEHRQETLQIQSRRFSRQDSQSYSGEVCGEEQQQYLLQPLSPQKQRPQLTFLDAGRAQVRQERKQHFERTSPLDGNLQQQRPSLSVEQYRIQQPQVLEEENLGSNGQFQGQMPGEGSDFTAAGSQDLTGPGDAVTGLSEVESRYMPQQYDVNSSACLYASQTTASSLSASCLSARSCSAAGSPSASSTQNAQVSTSARRLTTRVHDSDSPTPVAGIPSDQNTWSSASESVRWSSPSKLHGLVKPAAGAAFAPVSLGPAPHCGDTSGTLPVLNSVSPPTTSLAEAVSDASTLSHPATTPLVELSTPAGATIRGAHTIMQNSYGLPCNETTLYQNKLPRSCSSGTRTIASSAAQQQWQQASFPFAAGACAHPAITQSLMLQQQELQPDVQQQQQQYGDRSDNQQQKFSDFTQPHEPPHQERQYQRQQHVEAPQRPPAHQPLQQQGQIQHLHPQTALSPNITQSPHHSVYMQQRAVQGEPHRSIFHSQQSVQHQQTTRQAQGLYQPQELPQYNIQGFQLQQQPPKVQLFQPPQLSVQHPGPQQRRANDSHYPHQRESVTPAIPNAAAACNPPEVSTLCAASVPTTASSRLLMPSVASGNYGVAGHTRIEEGSNRDDSGNISAHITLDTGEGHTLANTQSQLLHFPQQLQQQQLLTRQHQQECPHQGNQKPQSGDEHTGYVGLPVFHNSLTGGDAPVPKEPHRLQQQHGVHPGPLGSSQVFYAQQPCQLGQKQQSNQGAVCTSPLACQQENTIVAPSHPQVSLCSAHPHSVQPASSVAAVFVPSSNYIPRPSCLPSPSVSVNSCLQTTSNSLAPPGAPVLTGSALQPDAPAVLHPTNSRPSAMPTAGGPPSAEDMTAAGGASASFSVPVPRYSISGASHVEQLPLNRASQPNLSFYSGSAASPSRFYSNSANSPVNCAGYQASSHTVHPGLTSCIPGGGHADAWSVTQSGSSSDSYTKGNAKRVGTPQQKNTSRRCPQYRQHQQHRSESPAGSNTALHTLRAVRGLPMQQRKLFRNLARQTPRVQGLTFDHNQIRWISYWKNSQGKQIQRHFPVSRFGFIEARRMALEERNRILGWPLDTDEAADAIAELTRTAEQSLQLLLQQSFATGAGTNSDGAPAAAAFEKTAEVVLGGVSAGVAVRPEGATALVGETNMKESSLPTTALAPAEEMGGSLQTDEVERENALPIEGRSAPACSADLEQQQFGTGAASGAEGTSEECYFSTAETTAYSERMDIATGATTGAAVPPIPPLGTEATAGDSSEESRTAEEIRHSSSAAETPSGEEKLSSSYASSSDGTYQTCSYGFQDEIATGTTEKKHTRLQCQPHRASFISASSTDQERACEGGRSGSQMTTALPLEQACSYPAICPTAPYSGTDAGTTVGGGNAGAAASSVYEDMHQRDRSAASTNVEEDIEVAALAVENSAHPGKRLQQQEWQLCCDEQQHVHPTTAGASTNTNNFELHPAEVTPQEPSHHQSLPQQQQQHQQVQRNEQAFLQQRWLLQDQPLKQREDPQGMAARTSYGTTMSRRPTQVNSSNTSNGIDISSTAVVPEMCEDEATEVLPPRHSYSGQSQSIDHVYEATSCLSMGPVQQQHCYEINASSTVSPLLVQQRLEPVMFSGQQQPPSNDTFHNTQAPMMPGQRQALRVSQDPTQFCNVPSTLVAPIHVSETPAVVYSIVSAATGCSNPAESGVTTAPGLKKPTAGSDGGGAAAAIADAPIPRPNQTAAGTSVRSKQQPRQRERSRKKKNDVLQLPKDMRSSGAAAVVATALLPPNTVTPASTLANATGGLTMLCSNSLELAGREHSGALRETANTIEMTRTDIAETATSPNSMYFSTGEYYHGNDPAAVASVMEAQQQVTQLPSTESFAHFSRRSCSIDGAVAKGSKEKDANTFPDIDASGICSATQNDCSKKVEQGGALYNNQTLFWNSAKPCTDWKQWQYQGEQQDIVHQVQQVATQGFSCPDKNNCHFVQQQTQPSSITEILYTSPQQEQPSQGRQKRPQRTSTKNKAMVPHRSSLHSPVSTSSQVKTTTPDAATAAVAAAAATATAAAVAAATATAAAAVSSSTSGSLKRKKPSEQEGWNKRAQSGNTRKTRRKCKPEEQQKHALFSAAAAAAREAVDTLPEPIIHPQLLQRHFHPSALIQYIQQQQQPLPVHTVDQGQQANTQLTRQDNNKGQLLLGDSTSRAKATMTAAPSQPHSKQQLHSQQQGGQQKHLVGQQQQQQLSEEQQPCQQQEQQKPLGRQQPVLSITDLSSEGNERRSLVPTPPQTPSCAAPYDFSIEGSRSNSCCRRKDLDSCSNNSASRRQVLSNSYIHSNHVNSIINHADSRNHSTSSRHSTTSSSTPATFNGKNFSHAATTINDGSNTCIDSSEYTSLYTSCSNNSGFLSNQHRPLQDDSFSCGDATGDNCSEGHSSNSSSYRKESWFDDRSTIKDVLLPEDAATCLSNKSETSSTAAGSLAFQNTAAGREEVSAGTLLDTAAGLDQTPAAPQEQIMCTTGSLHPSPMRREDHSPYFYGCHNQDSSNSITNSGLSESSQCSARKEEINTALAHPLSEWTTRSFMSDIRESPQEHRDFTEKEDGWKNDLEQKEQQQHPQQGKQHDKEGTQKHQHSEQQQQQKYGQWNEPHKSFKQKKDKRTCTITGDTGNSRLCVKQPSCDDDADGIAANNQLIKENQMPEEIITGPVSGEFCRDSRISSQQRTSFTTDATVTPSTEGCPGGGTEDVCVNTSCTSNSSSINGTTDNTALSCSPVSHVFPPRNTSTADASFEAGTIDITATRDAVLRGATSADVKSIHNSVPVSIVSSSSSLPQYESISVPCWWGASGATDTCSVANQNTGCYAGLCMQQQGSISPTTPQNQPATNDTVQGAVKTETEATQDPMHNSAWTPGSLRNANCTSHHVRPHPYSRGADPRASRLSPGLYALQLCVQSCPAKVCARVSLPGTLSCSPELEQSASLAVCPQKQQQALLEQKGGSKRRNSAIYSAESGNIYNCRETHSSMGGKEQIEQALLCCSSSRTSETAHEKEQNISSLHQESVSSLQQKVEQDQEEQQRKDPQHPSTGQYISQEAVEAPTSCRLGVSQTDAKTVERSQVVMNSNILFPFSFCFSSSKDSKDGIDTADTPVSTSYPAPLSSLYGGKKSSGESNKTRDDHHGFSMSCWEGVHENKYMQQQSEVAQNPRSSAAAVTGGAAAGTGKAAAPAAISGAAVPSSSLLPTAPTPPSGATEPMLQGFLQASGDFFQLLPSPRRPSCDWLGCDSNHLPILQPRCSRSSTLSHTAADNSLISPSSASSAAAVISDTTTGAAASVNERYSFSAASTVTEGIAAPTRAVTATTSSEPPTGSPAVASSVFPASGGAATEEKCQSVHATVSPSPSSQQQEQHSASDSRCSMILLGSQGYYTGVSASLSTVSAAAQHQQQLSPLWTATVPLPALFRTSTSSSFDSFSALPSVASDFGTKSAAATPLVNAAAGAADPAGSVEIVSHCNGRNSNSRLCEREKNPNLFDAASRSPVIKDVDTHVHSGIEAKKDYEPVWKSSSGAREARDTTAAADCAVNTDETFPATLTATGEQVRKGATHLYQSSTSGSSDLSCFAEHLLSPAATALRTPSSHVNGNSLLRSCTAEAESALSGPCRIESTPLASSVVETLDHPNNSVVNTAVHSTSSSIDTPDHTASSRGDTGTQPALSLVHTAADPTSSLADTAAATSPVAAQEYMKTAAVDTGLQKANERATAQGRGQKLKKRGSSFSALKRRRMTETQREEEAMGDLTGPDAAGCSSGGLQHTSEAPAAVSMKAESEEITSQTIEALRARTLTEGGAETGTTECVGEDERQHQPVGRAQWCSTTAASDAAHGAEEGSRFFPSSCSWSLTEKLSIFPFSSSFNAESCTYTRKQQQQPLLPSPIRTLPTAASDLQSHTVHKDGNFLLCSPGMIPADTTRDRKDILSSRRSLDSEDNVSPLRTAAADRQQTTASKKPMLLSTPLFAAQDRISDGFCVQHRDQSLPPAAGAATPWTGAAAASSSSSQWNCGPAAAAAVTITSWTAAAAAGERGWSPLFSFAAVPPSPVDATGRYMRLSSPRFSVLAPLSATAATTCCSSSTTEADAGAPFGFPLHDRPMEVPSSSDNTSSTHEKAL